MKKEFREYVRKHFQADIEKNKLTIWFKQEKTSRPVSSAGFVADRYGSFDLENYIDSIFFWGGPASGSSFQKLIDDGWYEEDQELTREEFLALYIEELQQIERFRRLVGEKVFARLKKLR